MRYLCVCAGGVARSASLARVLNHCPDFEKFELEAVPISYDCLKDESVDLFGIWADWIILMQPKFMDRFEKFRKKVRIFDIGPDVWGEPGHPDLLRRMMMEASKWAQKGFRDPGELPPPPAPPPAPPLETTLPTEPF